MTTPSSFYNGLAPYGQMFTDALIAQRSVEKYVVKTYPQYNIYNRIIELLGGEPTLVHVGNRLFDMYNKGNTFPAASIATRTLQPNGQLIIEWDDANFNAIVPGNAVSSASTGVLAIVSNVFPGQATLTFFYSPAGDTAFTSSDFVLGTTASDRGDVGNIQSSGSKQRVIEKPFRNQNIVDLVRNTAELTMDEMNQLTYITNINGTPYYAQNQVIEMLERTAKQKYTRTLDGEFVNDPRTPMGMGLKNQIRTQGGLYYPLATALDEDAWQSFIEQYVAMGSSTGDELLVIGGSSFLAHFQKFMRSYLVTAGDTNTFGGVSVKGLDFENYWYIGRHLRVMYDPSMDNNQMWNNDTSTVLPGILKKSHSAFVFNTSKVQTEQGLEPFIKKYYFGPTGADMWMTSIPGMVSIDPMNRISFQPTNSSLSGKVEVVYNCTTQLTNPAAHGYIYLSA
jgi:hypothetical protein